MKYYCCVIILFFSFRDGYSQYFQFSQYNFSAQRVNPAMVGNTRYASASVSSRTQKTGGDFNILSNFVSGSYPLLNSSTGKPWAGIGVTLTDDRSGGIFSTQEMALSYALHLRLDRFSSLSFGFRGVFLTKGISLDGFNTSLQYVPDRGFSKSLSSGESLSTLRVNYATFSMGLYWQQLDRKENKTSYWGISLFDINKPRDNFFGNSAQLPSTLVLEGGFRLHQQGDVSIYPEVLFSGGNGNSTVNVGARIQYDVRPMPNQSATSKIDVLAKYVPGRSGILGLQFHKENFSFGASYDFPFFTSNAGNLGALEVGLEIRKLVTTRAQKLRARRQKEIEARKKLQKTSIRNIAQKKSVDSVRQDTVQIAKGFQGKRDSTAMVSAPVEIQKLDSVTAKFDAKAGNLKQEPYLVEKITLRFQFPFNSVDLDDETESFLDDLSKTLEADPELSLKIVGHTDNVGAQKYNERLSHRRAEEVKKFLVRRGIDPHRITTDGKGMSEPLRENDTEKNRAINRRVEMLLFK